MAGADLAFFHGFAHRNRQAEQTQHIGDMAAALADDLRQRLLGMAEFLHQAPVAFGFLNGGQILALDILDQCDFQRLTVVEFADNDRNLVQLRRLRRTPAPLSRDNLVARRIGRVPADQDGLQHALVADRIDQRFHLLGGEQPTRLKRSRLQILDRRGLALPHLVELGIILAVLAQQRVEATPKILSLFACHQAARLRSRFITSLARWI